MILRQPTNHQTSRGQSLAEFALVLTPLCLVFLGLLQFGMIFGTQIGLTNATREASRYAATLRTDTLALATQNGPAVLARLKNTPNGMLARNVMFYGSTNLVVPANASGDAITRICYWSYNDPSGFPAVMVRVDTSYRHPLFIPLISAIIDGIDGIANNALRVGSSEAIRVGNEQLSSTNIPGAGSPACYS